MTQSLICTYMYVTIHSKTRHYRTSTKKLFTAEKSNLGLSESYKHLSPIVLQKHTNLKFCIRALILDHDLVLHCLLVSFLARTRLWAHHSISKAGRTKLPS